jgi:hypothetical protein
MTNNFDRSTRYVGNYFDRHGKYMGNCFNRSEKYIRNYFDFYLQGTWEMILIDL